MQSPHIKHNHHHFPFISMVHHTGSFISVSTNYDGYSLWELLNLELLDYIYTSLKLWFETLLDLDLQDLPLNPEPSVVEY